MARPSDPSPRSRTRGWFIAALILTAVVTVLAMWQPWQSMRERQASAPALQAPSQPARGVSIPSVSISAALDMNQGRATQIALVLANDPARIGQLDRMSARDWFAHHGEVQNQAVGRGELLEIYTYGVTPGLTQGINRLAGLSEARAAFVFALYETPGAHRYRLEGSGPLTIVMGRERAQVTMENGRVAGTP